PPPPPGDAINIASITSFEFSKQWRFKPLHDGSVVSMFVGPRYSTINARDDLNYYVVPDPAGGADLAIEGIHSANHLYGAQIGLRWFKQKGRWTLSTEGRYYYSYNEQNFSGSYGNNTVASGDPRVYVAFDEQRWVHAGDLRLEATYDITKSFAVTAGWDMLYFGNGVARGMPPLNDQDIVFTGWTLGFSMNR
ncbi:MAG: BBP7 family outer membrane beta-barrel protein, partial [Planctomycetales bacterium]